MTDSEKNDICRLLNRARDLCYKLADVEQKLEDRHGIEFCSISPEDHKGYKVEMNVYRGIEKILEATGCESTVEDFLDGKTWKHADYSGDTSVFQISEDDGSFEKAKETNDED